VVIVDLDLLFQNPQEYARIIGGKWEGSKQAQEVQQRRREKCSRTLRTPSKTLGGGEEAPFIANQNMAIGGK
jgi:hypothetical protein